MRAVMAALLVLLSSTASGQAVDGRKPWHSEVVPANPRLPSIAIDLGYPGPYVPALNSPIAIHATANGSPFDGYIGFHYAVRDRLTLDTPVIARAILRPHSSWAFTTTTNLHRCCVDHTIPREVVVEWRDRARHLIASSNAGIPPRTSWDKELKPLRVIASPSERVPQTLLGSEAYVEHSDALPDRAQWYVGFSAVVLPVSTWLDLRTPARDAIFSSAVPVVFFGFPRANQRLGHLDEALLPVSFDDARTSAIAKKGSDTIGPADRPSIARTLAAVWAAGEDMIVAPIPTVSRFENARYERLDTYELESKDRADDSRRDPGRITARENFIAAHAGATAAAVALLLTVAAWLLLRKTPRFAMAMAIIVAASLLVAARSRIRPASAIREYVVHSPVAAGISDHVRVWHAYGPAPLAAVKVDSETAKLMTAGDFGRREDAEVRTDETLPSLGLLHDRGDWDAATRWSSRRELDDSATGSRISRRTQYDFHTPFAVWFADRPDSGTYKLESPLATAPDGRATFSFALPADSRSRSVTVHFLYWFAGRDIEITWPNGSHHATLAKNDVRTDSFAVIPKDVCRSIAAQGGVAKITVAGPFGRSNDRAWLEVREYDHD